MCTLPITERATRALQSKHTTREARRGHTNARAERVRAVHGAAACVPQASTPASRLTRALTTRAGSRTNRSRDSWLHAASGSHSRGGPARDRSPHALGASRHSAPGELLRERGRAAGGGDSQLRRDEPHAIEWRHLPPLHERVGVVLAEQPLLEHCHRLLGAHRHLDSRHVARQDDGACHWRRGRHLQGGDKGAGDGWRAQGCR